MSLLLDALKKAEKAKGDAERRAQLADGVDPEATVVQVRTRNELPDISRPLEIHAEDIPGGIQLAILDSPVPDASPAAPAAQPAAQTSAPILPEAAPDQTPRRRQATREKESAADSQTAQRAAVKNVFDAKFREPNPKLPFYITMAVLGAFAVGTVVYFWYQLRPPPSLVNTAGKPQPGEKNVDAAQAQPPSPPTAPQAPTQAPAIPGLPGPSAAPAPPVAAPASPAGPVVAAPAGPTVLAVKPAAPRESAVQSAGRGPGSAPRPQNAAQTARAAADPSKLSVNRAEPAVNPKLEAGWHAYNQGNLEAARSNYRDMLRDEPSNRDALLGMAAIEARANRLEQSEAYYQKLLDIDPRDPHAQAGLFALRAQTTDPVQAESRLKSLLANDPTAHILFFTLGNQYAQQGRWPEAQQAYFKALSADPENPDFAYNLAVSLDQVRQPKLALEYYRRAISLAQQRSSSFDQTLARNRAQELAR